MRRLEIGEPGMGVALVWSYFPNAIGVLAVSSKVVDMLLICNPGEFIEVPKDTETVGLLSNALNRKTTNKSTLYHYAHIQSILYSYCLQ